MASSQGCAFIYAGHNPHFANILSTVPLAFSLASEALTFLSISMDKERRGL